MADRQDEDYDAYFWGGIGSDGKFVLDAGTGAGKTTEAIVNRAIETDADCEIVGIDIDMHDIERTRKNLGERSKRVKFLCADLRDMREMTADSVDVIFCTYTVCALESNPMDSLSMFREFRRVLKTGGRIVIEEELPHPTEPEREHEVWARKWAIERSLQHLCGIPHFREVSPENLAFALRLSGFGHVEWKAFKGEQLRRNSLDWFRRKVEDYVERLQNPALKDGFISEMNGLREKLGRFGDKFLDFYVLHATRID